MVKKRSKVGKLLALAKGKKNALIMPHDYADPDAIAAALALKRLLAGKLKLRSTVSFNRVVGRVENRELCEYLKMDISPTDDIDFDDYDFVVLVDCQPGTGNNSLPESRQADAVIDHHPREENLEGVSFIDIQENCGASSTIVTEYLVDAEVKISKPLATALVYGIKTDALNFARKTKEKDIAAYLELFRLADVGQLSRIESAVLPRGYYRDLNDAIKGAGIYDNVLVSDLGAVDHPGMLGEFADLFLRMEDVDIVLCFGVCDEKLLISMRSLEPRIHAGKAIRHAVGKRGTAGGHAAMAGGQIPLLTETKKEESDHKKAVIGRMFERLGIEGKRKRKIA